MRLRNDRGQILPISLFLLTILVCMIGLGGERALLQIQKIREQRKADAVTLIATNQQVRALNAIAGLNKALRTIRRNAYIVALVTVAVDICALGCLVVAGCVCLKPAANLTLKMRTFVPKINKLGKEVANAQDRILAWANIAPGRTILLSNLLHEGGAWNYLSQNTIDPGNGAPRALQLFRPGVDDLDVMIESDEEVSEQERDLANGGDIMSCKPKTIGNNRDYITFANRFRPGQDTIDFSYQVGGRGVVPSTEIVPVHHFKGDHPTYKVVGGTGQKCTSFRAIVRRNGPSSLLFQIPAPYVLLPTFNEKQHLALGRQSRSRATEGFDHLLSEDSSSPFSRLMKASKAHLPQSFWGELEDTAETLMGEAPAWSLSQAQIVYGERDRALELVEDDSDSNESTCSMCDMNFYPQLQRFSEAEKIMEAIENDRASHLINLGGINLEREDFEDALLH